MNARVADIARFYDLLDRLAVRVGGLRVLADCSRQDEMATAGHLLLLRGRRNPLRLGQRPSCRTRRDARGGERLPGHPLAPSVAAPGDRPGPGAATTVARSSACSWAPPWPGAAISPSRPPGAVAAGRPGWTGSCSSGMSRALRRWSAAGSAPCRSSGWAWTTRRGPAAGAP